MAEGSRFFGWRVVRATFVMAIFGWGIGFYAPSVLLQAVSARHDWPVWIVSAAVTTHFLVGVVVVANIRRLYARFGVARVTGAGALVLAGGLCAWGAAGSLPALFAAAALTGAGWVALGAAAVNAIIAPWFDRGRPLALSIAYNGASVGGILVPPALVWLIAAVGFPAATAILAAVLALGVPALAARYFARSPAELGQQPDGGPAPGEKAARGSAPPRPPLGNPWRDGRVVTLALGMALGLAAQAGLLAHLYSMLVPALGLKGAGLAMSVATGAAILGRMAVGAWLPPQADRRLVAAGSYLVQAVGVLLLAPATHLENPVLILAAVALFGAGIGNATSLPPLVAQVEFDAADAARVIPLIIATSQATYAVAPLVLGLAAAAWPRNAALAILALVLLTQLAAALAFLLGRRAASRPSGLGGVAPRP